MRVARRFLVALVAVSLLWVSVGNAADPVGPAGPEIGELPAVSELTPPAGVPVPRSDPGSPAGKRVRGLRLSLAEQLELRRERLRSRGAFGGLDRAGALAAFRSEHRAVLRERGFSPLAGLKVEEIRNERAAVIESPRAGQRRPSLMVSTAPLATEDESGDLVAVDKSLEEVPGGFAPSVTGDALAIGDQATDAVQVGDQGDLAVRALGVADSPAVLERDTVVYPNVMRDTDLALRPAPEGVQTFHHLRSPESPETVSLALSLPDGAVLDGDDVHGWQIVRGDTVLGNVTAPVAFDANLEPVEVETQVNGSTLQMTVRHREKELQYPLVLDPIIQRSSHNTQIWNQGHAYHGWNQATYGPGFEYWADNHPYWPQTLIAASQPGMHYTSANGQWYYNAGGETARIWWSKFYGWSVPAPYSNPETHAFTGLWSRATGNWEISNYGAAQLWTQDGTFAEWAPAYCPLPAAQPTWSNPDPGCIDWGGSYNNAAIFGVFMRSSAVRPQYSVTFIRGFGVAIADWHAPWSHADTTTSWTQDGQVHVAAGDTGLGVKQIIIEAPNQPQWNGRIVDTINCDASTWQPCPRERHYWPTLGNLPKGQNHTLRVYVTDAVGNVLAAPRDFIVGVPGPYVTRDQPDEPDPEVPAYSGPTYDGDEAAEDAVATTAATVRCSATAIPPRRKELPVDDDPSSEDYQLQVTARGLIKCPGYKRSTPKQIYLSVSLQGDFPLQVTNRFPNSITCSLVLYCYREKEQIFNNLACEGGMGFYKFWSEVRGRYLNLADKWVDIPMKVSHAVTGEATCRLK